MSVVSKSDSSLLLVPDKLVVVGFLSIHAKGRNWKKSYRWKSVGDETTNDSPTIVLY